MILWKIIFWTSILFCAVLLLTFESVTQKFRLLRWVGDLLKREYQVEWKLGLMTLLLTISAISQTAINMQQSDVSTQNQIGTLIRQTDRLLLSQKKDEINKKINLTSALILELKQNRAFIDELIQNKKTFFETGRLTTKLFILEASKNSVTNLFFDNQNLAENLMTLYAVYERSNSILISARAASDSEQKQEYYQTMIGILEPNKKEIEKLTGILTGILGELKEREKAAAKQAGDSG